MVTVAAAPNGGDDGPLSLARAVMLTRDVLAATWESASQAQRVIRVLERFAVFASVGFGVVTPGSVTPDLAERFIHAPVSGTDIPSPSLIHFRRSSLRLFFGALRQVGVEVGDPTLDVKLPPRSQRSCRALTDDEVGLCRGFALWSLNDHRRAAAWALAEATCRSVEIAQVRRSDVDLTSRRVWIHGGRTTAPRWGHISEWGVARIEQRLNDLPRIADTRVAYAGAGDAATGQVSACVAIVDVLTRAGLAAEPDVRPASVAAWAGRRVLAETGRIDEVARRLGMGSLDRTARFIGFDWQPSDQ